MTSHHLTQETVRSFLNAELNRRENRLIVRHLLTRCRHCLDIVQEADRMVGLGLTGASHGPALQMAVRMG
jgi:hypothetical protein